MNKRKRLLTILLAIVVSVTMISPWQSAAVFAINSDVEAVEETSEQAAPEETEAIPAEQTEAAPDAEAPAASDADEVTESQQDTKAKDGGKTDDESVQTKPTAEPKETTDNLSFEGEHFGVEINAQEQGAFPADTQLQAEEITKDTKGYQAYYDKALAAVQDTKAGKDVASLQFAKFYDISLMNGAKELEPAKPCDVTLTFEDKLKAEETKRVQVVHFTENEKTGKIKAEVLNAKDVDATIEKKKLTETSFTADAFSVYGIVYTVDFWYGEYEYHLDGDKDIMLSVLLGELGLLDAEETGNTGAENTSDKAKGAVESAAGAERIAMEDIVDVRFSDESLVKVTREDQADGTADWKLTSLKAFDTEETLTIETKDGVVDIRVTDAQKTSESEATFKLELPGAAAANRMTYWDTWTEVVNKANEVHSDNANNKITVLKDCDVIDSIAFADANFRMTIDGNGHTISLKGTWNNDFIVWGKNTSANVLNINNITIDASAATGNVGIIHNTTSTANRASSISITKSVFIRGSLTGVLIDAGKKDLTLSNCTIDGSNNLYATSSLIKMNGGSLTMTDVTVSGHRANVNGICAIDASTGNGGIYVNGEMHISDNKANDKEANLNVGAKNVTISSSIGGALGVTNNNSQLGGQVGIISSDGVLGARCLVNDNDTTMTGVLRSTGNAQQKRQIVWTNVEQSDPQVSGAVCQLLIGGTVLQQYTTFKAGLGAANNINGTVTLEILCDITTSDNNTAANAGRLDKDHTLYITSKGGAYTIKYSNSNWFMQINNGDVHFSNIVFDGTKDMQRNGDMGHFARIDGGTVTFEDGCTIQNFESTGGNGGAICLERASLIMKKGSVIQNCECTSNGGAIHIHRGGYFTCDGGTLRNNTAVTGGAICLNYGTGSRAATIKGNSILEGNSATNGGAIYNNYGTANYSSIVKLEDNTIIRNNTAKTNGGAYYCDVTNSTFDVSDNVKITGNKAGKSGSAIYASASNDDIIIGGNAEITGNTITEASDTGGAVYNTNATVSISGSPIVRNNTEKDGSERNIYLVKRQLEVIGNLTGGDIGIYETQYYKTSDQFGTTAKMTVIETEGADENGNSDVNITYKKESTNAINIVELNHLTNDRTKEAIPGATTRLVGVPGDGNKVFWYYVCQIVKDGQVKKVYGALEDAAADVNSFGDGELSIEMLISAYQDYKAANINKTDGATVTLTSRTTGSYAYQDFGRGSNGKSTIYRGYNGDSLLTVSKGNLNAEKITLDGHNKAIDSTDSNTFSSTNKGGLVKLNNADSTLTIKSNTTLRNSTSADHGGAVWLKGGSTLLMASTGDAPAMITGCSAKNGGAIYSESGSTNILLHGNPEITGNTASGQGGGIAANKDNRIYMENVKDNGKGENSDKDSPLANTTAAAKISNNTAQNGGGGIFLGSEESSKSALYMLGTSQVNNNTARENGGGIYLGSYATMNADGSALISGNTASGQGGGVAAANNTKVNLSGDTKVQSNTAQANGGGIAMYGGSELALNGNAQVLSNTATAGNGGGIWVNDSESEGAKLTVSGDGSPQISSNKAQNGQGGGVWLGKKSTATLSNANAKIVKNSAAQNGGGVFSNGTLDVSAGTFSENTAGNEGGGIAVQTEGSLTVSGNTLIDKCYATHGAGVHSYANLTTIQNKVKITDCYASGYGGGVYINQGSLVVKDNVEITGCKAGYDQDGSESVNDLPNASGGGINMGWGKPDAMMTIQDSVKITNCVAKGYGGGVSVEGNYDSDGATTGIITGNVEISGCTAKNGGGIVVGQSGNRGSLTLTGSVNVKENKSTENGGGLYLNNSPVSITGSAALRQNGGKNEDTIKTQSGGGIYAAGTSTINMMDSANVHITNSVATKKGSGVYLAEGAVMSMNSGHITTGFTTEDWGGGVYLAKGSRLNVSGSPDISDNKNRTGNKPCDVVLESDAENAAELHLAGNLTSTINVYALNEKHDSEKEQFAILDNPSYTGYNKFVNQKNGDGKLVGTLKSGDTDKIYWSTGGWELPVHARTYTWNGSSYTPDASDLDGVAVYQHQPESETRKISDWRSAYERMQEINQNTWTFATAVVKTGENHYIQTDAIIGDGTDWYYVPKGTADSEYGTKKVKLEQGAELYMLYDKTLPVPSGVAYNIIPLLLMLLTLAAILTVYFVLRRKFARG